MEQPCSLNESRSAYLVRALVMVRSTQPTRSCSPVPMAVVAPSRTKMTELELTPASMDQAKIRSCISLALGWRAV